MEPPPLSCPPQTWCAFVLTSRRACCPSFTCERASTPAFPNVASVASLAYVPRNSKSGHQLMQYN